MDSPHHHVQPSQISPALAFTEGRLLIHFSEGSWKSLIASEVSNTIDICHQFLTPTIVHARPYFILVEQGHSYMKCSGLLCTSSMHGCTKLLRQSMAYIVTSLGPPITATWRWTPPQLVLRVCGWYVVFFLLLLFFLYIII